MNKIGKLGGLILTLAFFSGCSINWYDERTGTQHLLGFGYLKMRAASRPPTEDPSASHRPMAYATGVRDVGLQLGAGNDFTGISLGWDARSRVVIRNPDSSFSLVWPTNAVWMPDGLKDFFNVYVGTNFPFLIENQAR